jgi:hypothetical protein
LGLLASTAISMLILLLVYLANNFTALMVSVLVLTLAYCAGYLVDKILF